MKARLVRKFVALRQLDAAVEDQHPPVSLRLEHLCARRREKSDQSGGSRCSP